ncbi:MAG: thioredoxin family protein [Phycisphaerales bacterium]
MKNTGKRILGLIAGAALMGFAVPTAMAQDHAAPSKKEQPAETTKAKVGQPAPAFELKDTDGKTVKLSDYKGKVVVIDWFNPECPVCVMHYKANSVQDLAAKFKDKNVVFLAINSGAPGKQGHGVELNATAKKDWKVEFPVLLDESGTVGRAYGAKTTPHCYVIDAKGVLVYAGAIDDGKPGKIGKVNYVEQAVKQTLAGETVSTPETKPYGCSVKYGGS